MPSNCQHRFATGLQCTTRPCYGLPGSLAASFCATHQLHGMIDIHHKRCDHPGGCILHPSFGLPDGPATRCSSHKLSGMVNTQNKHCDHPGGCTVQPSFGLLGCRATRCSAHKEPDMINVKAKRCDHPGGCTVHPSFGLPDGPATRCAAHMGPDMIDVKHRSRSSGTSSNRLNGSPAPDGSGADPSVAAAASAGGERAPPLEGGSRPALSRRHPASQPRPVPRTASCSSTAPPSSAAATHGSSMRPRQEPPVTGREGEAADSGGRR